MVLSSLIMESVDWLIPIVKALTNSLENVLLVTMDMHLKMESVSIQPTMYQLLILTVQNSKTIFVLNVPKISSLTRKEPALQLIPSAKPTINSIEHAPAVMIVSC